jgi:hypothetical protein
MISASAYGETFKLDYLAQKPKDIKAYNKDDGKFLWESTSGSSLVKMNGKETLVINEKASGVWNGKDKRTWKVENYYTYENNRAVPHHSSITFYDMSGKIADVQKKTYSLKDKKVYCDKNGEKKDFDFEEDLIDKELLGTCLMNYPYTRKSDLEFHMMTNEPSHYKMTMQNKGIETVKINGKNIECYKLQMIPDLGFLGIFAPLVPKTYFWYKVEAPHEFVRYEGLESGLNTPYIVMEAQE